MSSKKLSTNNGAIDWNSSILELASGPKPSQSILKLQEAGYGLLKDLLWILPLRVQKAPKISPFTAMKEGALFLGKGKLVNANFVPAFGRKGKSRVQLFNATLLVQDLLSGEAATLKFFNAYPNLRKSLEEKETFTFMGQVQQYKGALQIINPKLEPKSFGDSNGMLVEYPTVATVAGKYIQGIMAKIPERLWSHEASIFKSDFPLPLKNKSLARAFSILHGRLPSSDEEREEALKYLIYREFFEDQLKILARRKSVKSQTASLISWPESFYKDLLTKFPYTLTQDQLDALAQIKEDFASGRPMMRMIQGDVGCGKTTVAFLAAMMAAKNQGQAALMCPTESLALQHLETFKGLLSDSVKNPVKVDMLLGSSKPSEKKKICQSLAEGKTGIVIGTHSLIQDSVAFKNLQFVIIDEQHKFGVEQRQKLASKNPGVHTLIMTATPIPRTLQLAQFGDLDISTIRTMPKGRSGIKTRIVTEASYPKYLSFVKTRLSMGEQAYIVAPAIVESEILDIRNVEGIEKEYRKYFPEFKVKALHGRMKPAQKQEVFHLFGAGEIDVLISTSVIEVGINVANATVMSVYNPERFGLSSLHQLRGRVGRGAKPGFCFLLAQNGVGAESLSRLQVVEKSCDGFQIAEADLKNRGEGDLFGISQSGAASQRKVASVFKHFDIFDQVTQDLSKMVATQEEALEAALERLAQDQKVSSTI